MWDKKLPWEYFLHLIALCLSVCLSSLLFFFYFVFFLWHGSPYFISWIYGKVGLHRFYKWDLWSLQLSLEGRTVLQWSQGWQLTGIRLGSLKLWPGHVTSLSLWDRNTTILLPSQLWWSWYGPFECCKTGIGHLFSNGLVKLLCMYTVISGT